MKCLALGVVLLAGWVLSVNTILRPYLAPVQTGEGVAVDDDAAALPDATAVLPVMAAPAMTQLAAAAQPAATDPAADTSSEPLPVSAEASNSPVLTASITSPVRLASAAPTVGGADISDAAVIAKAVEPAGESLARAAPMPRIRPRTAAIPLPRPRPHFASATSPSFLSRLFGAR